MENFLRYLFNGDHRKTVVEQLLKDNNCLLGVLNDTLYNPLQHSKLLDIIVSNDASIDILLTKLCEDSQRISKLHNKIQKLKLQMTDTHEKLVEDLAQMRNLQNKLAGREEHVTEFLIRLRDQPERTASRVSVLLGDGEQRTTALKDLLGWNVSQRAETEPEVFGHNDGQIHATTEQLLDYNMNDSVKKFRRNPGKAEVVKLNIFNQLAATNENKKFKMLGRILQRNATLKVALFSKLTEAKEGIKMEALMQKAKEGYRPEKDENYGNLLEYEGNRETQILNKLLEEGMQYVVALNTLLKNDNAQNISTIDQLLGSGNERYRALEELLGDNFKQEVKLLVQNNEWLINDRNWEAVPLALKFTKPRVINITEPSCSTTSLPEATLASVIQAGETLEELRLVLFKSLYKPSFDSAMRNGKALHSVANNHW